MTPARAAIAARHQHRRTKRMMASWTSLVLTSVLGHKAKPSTASRSAATPRLLLAENERLEAAVHACFALGSDGKAKYVTANGILQDIPRRIEPFARAVLAPQEEA